MTTDPYGESRRRGLAAPSAGLAAAAGVLAAGFGVAAIVQRGDTRGHLLTSPVSLGVVGTAGGLVTLVALVLLVRRILRPGRIALDFSLSTLAAVLLLLSIGAAYSVYDAGDGLRQQDVHGAVILGLGSLISATIAVVALRVSIAPGPRTERSLAFVVAAVVAIAGTAGTLVGAHLYASPASAHAAAQPPAPCAPAIGSLTPIPEVKALPYLVAMSTPPGWDIVQTETTLKLTPPGTGPGIDAWIEALDPGLPEKDSRDYARGSVCGLASFTGLDDLGSGDRNVLRRVIPLNDDSGRVAVVKMNAFIGDADPAVVATNRAAALRIFDAVQITGADE